MKIKVSFLILCGGLGAKHMTESRSPTLSPLEIFKYGLTRLGQLSGLWDHCPLQPDAPEVPQSYFHSPWGVVREPASTLNLPIYFTCKHLSAFECSCA